MNIPTIIALGSLGAFFSIVIGLIFYQKWLTKITIAQHDKLYKYGDRVEGAVTIEARRDLYLDSLKISLDCTKLVSSDNTSAAHSRTYTLFEEKWLSDEPIKIMGRGDRKNFSYDFTLPNDHPKQQSRDSNNLTINIPNINDDYFKEFAENLSEYEKSRYRWAINVVAKNKNFTFSKSQMLSVEGYQSKDRKEATEDMNMFFKKRGRGGVVTSMFKLLKAAAAKNKKS